MPPSPRGGKEIDDFSQFQGGYCWILYIPQSKIKDFCQPPLGKGAFVPNLKPPAKLGFYEKMSGGAAKLDAAKEN